MSTNKYEPAVKRTTLIRTAGSIWIIIGLFLLVRGMVRLYPLEVTDYLIIGGGLLLGILKSQLIFRKIIDKNIMRINELAPHKDKICIFAFQAVQSYLLVAIMVTVGIIIRSLPIDNMIIGGILILIGTALVLSGINYLGKVGEVRNLELDNL